MIFNFIQKIEKAPLEIKLDFYDFLIHELTIGYRSIYHEERLNDKEKSKQLYEINEINHRLSSLIHVLRRNTHEWIDSDVWEMLNESTKSIPDLFKIIDQAIRFSYKHLDYNDE